MKITIQAGENTYLIAGKTTPVDGIGTYQGRLLNELKISRRFSKAGNAPLTLNISIRNNDGFIPRAVNLWAAVATVVTDTGYRWVGKITAYDRDKSEILNIVATERSAPELSIQFPDEVAGVVTLDENAHQSTLTLTLPLVVGGNADEPILIKGILIRKDLGIYKLCVGEIHQIVKVYRGNKEITTGFSAFTGSAGQANYAGYAYIQITDEALRKNDDGTYSEITADVIGLKLGSHSIEECRNGARFLQYLLTTPKDGICGWGLGISSAEINSASFATAISRVDAAGLKMDGVFYFRQIAQSWIDQICHAIRGDYEIGENGQRRLFVNANAASVKTYTKNNITLLRDGKGSYSGQVYNKGRLEFDFNPLSGIFMQSAQFEDPDCIDDIEEQTFLGQSYLIRDMATAQAILEYTCKKSIVGADKVYFETLQLPDNAKKGDIITIDYPEKSLTGTWQIFALDIGDFKNTIEAEKFSPNSFIVGSPGVKIDWPIEIPITSTVNPGSALGLSLSSEVRPSPDGTSLVVLKGTFTPPTSYLAATIEYAQGILPILSWTDLGMMRGNSFEVSGVEPGQPYAVRIRMVSANGKSDYITGTLTVQGDDIPPGAPSITVSSYLKTVKIKCVLSPYPDDMAGFEVFRSTTNNSAGASSIGKIDGKHGVADFIDTDTAYGMTYYYWAQAYDTWNNPSGFSEGKSTYVTFVQTADLADQILSESRLFAQGVVDAVALSSASLKQAGGAVAAWSAKGCTTASIAEAGGVVDTTGNGNNGQAFGGVAVVETDFGRALQFDGVDDYVSLWPDKTLENWTITGRFMRSDTVGNYGTLLGRALGGSLSLEVETLESTTGIAKFRLYPSSLGVTNYALNVVHHYVITRGPTKLTLYFDGELIGSINHSGGYQLTGGLYMGAWQTSQFFKGVALPPRIYGRELSASEAKTLFMFPDDAVFARITADFIGAYELVSRHHASDSVVARIIAAGAVTMEKLLVGVPGAALNDDPGFMDPSAWETMDGYASSAGWTLASITDGKVGAGVMRGNGASSPTSNAFIQKRYIPIDLSKTYRLHCLARKRNADTNGSIYLSVREYNNSKTVLSANAGHYLIGNVSPDTTWTEYNATIGPKGQFQFPAGTAFARIGGLIDYNTTAGAGFELQDYRLEECTPSTLIQNGAILGQHLTVEEAVITVAAQIAQLVVEDAHIKNMHGGKVIAGTMAITGLEESAQTTINTAYTNAGTALTNAAAAQSTANTAGIAAAAAQTSANNAQSSANTANNLLADIAADNKLTPLEKQDTRQEWDIIAAEKAGINAQAATFGITTENATYNSAFQALANYLNAGTTWSSGIPSWIADANLGATTTIVGATFRTNFKTYYDARTALLNAIAAKAKTLADAAQSAANAANSAASAAASSAATANTKAGNLATSGLGVKVNYAAFADANPGELYLHGFDSATGAAADVDGWVMWNGTKTTVAKGMINPNAVCPYNVPLYAVQRSGTKYIVWFDTASMAWKYSDASASAVLGTWTWGISTDIVLLTFVSPSSEGSLVGTQIFVPPKTGADLQDALDAAILSWAVANNLTYINGAKLYTGSVSAEKLLIGKAGSALNDDPNFEDATAWALAFGTIETVTDAVVGNKVFRTRVNGYGSATSGKLIPIDPNKTYRRKFKARGVNGAGGTTYVYDSYFDASGAFLGTKSVFVGNPPSGTWTDYHAVFQYPATARFVRIKVDANNGTPGASVCVEVQDNRLEEVIPGTLIKDGAVTTEKLTAEQIYGKDIRSGQNVGESNGAGGYVPGTRMKPTGFEAFNASGRTFFADNDGNAGIANFNFNEYGLSSLFGDASLMRGVGIYNPKGTFRQASFYATANIPDTYTTAFASVSADNGINTSSNFNNAYATASMGARLNTGGSEATAVVQVQVGSSSYYAFVTNGIIKGDCVDISDERLKSDIRPVRALSRLRLLDVTEWNYDDEKIRRMQYEKSVEAALKSGNHVPLADLSDLDVPDYKPKHRHVGAMAADFNRLFGVSGEDDEGINLSDGIGVALRAIQELAEIVDDQNSEIAELRTALNLPEKQKKQTDVTEFTAEEIEKAADSHVKAAYEAILQESKK